MIRDAALQASGLLNPAVGGPPVRPYQPAGVWEEILDGPQPIRAKRRGRISIAGLLYAFCAKIGRPLVPSSTARRCGSAKSERRVLNTPLQALTLLNDLTYVEAARVLAEQAAPRFERGTRSPGGSHDACSPRPLGSRAA